MKVAIAAYRLLQEVANAHGGVSRVEAEVIEAFRRGIGVSREDARAHPETPVAELAIEGSEREREEIVLAMARIAYADERLARAEREHIAEVAALLGLGRVQVANILGTVEREQQRAAVPASRFSPMFAGALTLVLAFLVHVALDGMSADPVQGSAAFQHIVDEHGSGVLLIHVAYDMRKGSERLRFSGDGSGFFATEDGLIVTNKHVIEPWKFLADRVRLLDTGFEVDESSIRISAWKSGADVFQGDGTLCYPTGWDTERGTLGVVAEAPDHWVRGRRSLSGGGDHAGLYHALDNSDLAVLRARLEAPVHALRMAPAGAPIRALDQVLVLGFPRGTLILEGRGAIPSPSVGVVSKVEDTIMISAPIHPGNSGGPVLDLDGDVIGVAARRAGGETLGRCIQAEHVRVLLASVE